MWRYENTNHDLIKFEWSSWTSISIRDHQWIERFMCVKLTHPMYLVALGELPSTFCLYLIVSDGNCVSYCGLFVLKSIWQCRIRDAKPPYTLYTSSTVESPPWIHHFELLHIIIILWYISNVQMNLPWYSLMGLEQVIKWLNFHTWTLTQTETWDSG